MSASALTAWRKRLGLSQAAAAEALGCGRRSLQKWEKGESPVPRYIALACAAVALGIGSTGPVWSDDEGSGQSHRQQSTDQTP